MNYIVIIIILLILFVYLLLKVCFDQLMNATRSPSSSIGLIKNDSEKETLIFSSKIYSVLCIMCWMMVIIYIMIIMFADDVVLLAESD